MGNCISEENVPQSTLIPINLILTSDAKTVFANFPITDRSLAIELRTLAQAPTTSEQVILKISSFFKEFRANVLHKLEIIEQKVTEKAKSISDFGSIIEKYNVISAKKELKAIVNNNEKKISVKSAEIKTICQEISAKNKNTTLKFEHLLRGQKPYRAQTPVLIKEQIFSQIDRIDMFLVEDFKQFQELSTINKLNGISVESFEHLKEQLNKINFAFSTVDVPEVGAIGIQKLIEDLAKNQQENQVDDDRENKENLVAANLLKLIRNKTNFCSNEQIEDVAHVMNILERVLGLFLVRKPRIQSEQQSAFNNLKENQLLNIAELTIKTNRITELHADSYLNSLTLFSSFQPNSNIIREIIQRDKGLHYLSNENKNLMDRILVNYPIFELLPPISNKQGFIPIPIKFTKTNYQNSQEILITENDGSVQFSFDPSKNGQVVREILDNSLGYLLKLKFSRPIAAASHGFFIGLIPDSSIHSNRVLSNSSESGLFAHTNQLRGQNTFERREINK